MLISTYREAETCAFEALLDSMLSILKVRAENTPKRIGALHGTKLERYAYQLLLDLSEHTIFSGSIELVSGQLFPDIIAKKYYGVEVKTSKSGTWKSIGSSVAEGTRVENIERIYLLFGKMPPPIDFRCRLYQDCLAGVAVTHSPRYTIDMELKPGETFFDQLGISYDELRRQKAPLNTVISHFRENLKPGETTWWLSNNDSKSTKAIIRLWSSLDKDEVGRLRTLGFCLFPELLSNSQYKFHRMLLWLSTEEGIVVGNLRDQYTSGGRVSFTFNQKIYDLPQIVHRLLSSLNTIASTLEELEIVTLTEYWGVNVIENRFVQWSKLVSETLKEISSFPLLDYLSMWYTNSNPKI